MLIILKPREKALEIALLSFLGSFYFKKMPFLQSIVKGLLKVSDNFFFKKSTLKEVFVLKMF
ncbi:hypothetical protein EWZ86_04315 [Helicobacter pylori]|nr:hypothetical protein [Helicobacter pylori]